MIGLLNGHVESVDADAALISVGGVGYEVRMPAADLSAPARRAGDPRVHLAQRVPRMP